MGAALDDLERILEAHRSARREVDAAPDDPDTPDDDGQYSIPLLSDVVVPGHGAPPTPVDEASADVAADDDGPLTDAETCRRIVQRLASEIDVIVQSRIESALKEASRDIRLQLRRHIDIVLPEILDELAEPEPDDEPDPR